MECLSLFDELLCSQIDSQFGSKDPQLKMIKKMVELDVDDDEKEKFINRLKKSNEEDARTINQYYTSTLDCHGNVVDLEQAPEQNFISDSSGNLVLFYD